MNNLLQLIHQSYIQLMHEFCQYPLLRQRLASESYSASTNVLAIGKAAWKMAAVTVHQLAEQGCEVDGYVLTNYGSALGAITGLAILEAGHPLTDATGLEASARIVAWLKQLPAKEDLIILLSGGTSALFEVLPPNLSLEAWTKQNKALLASGKSISEINATRTQHSLVKGGKALELVKAKHIRVYSVSDVPDNDPRILGSGPFTPSGEPRRIVGGYSFSLPGRKYSYQIVADNHSFLGQFAQELQHLGFRVYQDKTYHRDSVTGFGNQLKELLRQAYSPRFRLRPPFVYLFGGELTLTVSGSGQGGRCSHLALSLVNVLAKYPNAALFCIATDGKDHLAGNGGSYVDSLTRHRFQTTGINVTEAKKNFDSFTALKAIHQILPAPLLATNVNDIFLLAAGSDLENPLPATKSDEWDLFDTLL